MLTFIEPFEEFHRFNESSKALVSQIFAALPPDKNFQRIEADTDLANDPRFKDKLMVVKEGTVTYRRHGRRIFTYEQGDLIGIERLYFPSTAVEISSSFPLSVDIYSAHDVIAFLTGDLTALNFWVDYLTLRTSMFTSIMAATYESNMRNVQPKEEIYEPGSYIIEEGTLGDKVFCLLKGAAEVYAGGALVGKIKEDELFGMLAALTSAKRTASVKAVTRCHVAAIGKDDLGELIRSKPSTVVRMVEGLARVIDDLNKQVASAESKTVEMKAIDLSTMDNMLGR